LVHLHSKTWSSKCSKQRLLHPALERKANSTLRLKHALTLQHVAAGVVVVAVEGTIIEVRVEVTTEVVESQGEAEDTSKISQLPWMLMIKQPSRPSKMGLQTSTKHNGFSSSGAKKGLNLSLLLPPFALLCDSTKGNSDPQKFRPKTCHPFLICNRPARVWYAAMLCTGSDPFCLSLFLVPHLSMITETSYPPLISSSEKIHVLKQ
jgi:hypothetical protein